MRMSDPWPGGGGEPGSELGLASACEWDYDQVRGSEQSCPSNLKSTHPLLVLQCSRSLAYLATGTLGRPVGYLDVN